MTTGGGRVGHPRPHPYSGSVPPIATHRSTRTPTGRPALTAVALVLTAVLVSACGGSATATDGPRLTSPVRPAADQPDPPQAADPATTAGLPDGWTPDLLAWTGCDDGPDRIECATLRVPLDWSDPTGPTIDLAVARIPASGPADQRIGTIVSNPGGPGGSGVEFVSSNPFGGELAERFDQVGWDPRGVGDSTPVTCGSTTSSEFLAADPDPDTPEEQSELDGLARAVAEDCAGEDAELLAHIGTRDVARDLEALRLALDDGQLNYVGFSYGTQIGQYYAEMFPGGVRSMVLDGVVDPSLGFTDFLMGQIDGFDASFDRNAAACAADRRTCGVDDLAAAYDQVKEQVERQPLDADGTAVGPAELATAAIYTGYLTDGWERLGPALATALDGDGSRLGSLAAAYHDLGGYGAYAGVVCTDTPPPATPAEWQAFSDSARARSPRFGGSVANELLPCASWPFRSDAVPAAVTARDAPPILVVGNTGDPATPLSNAQAVADRLRSGVLLTVDMSGHTAYGSDACATDVIERYLLELEVPADGARCPTS